MATIFHVGSVAVALNDPLKNIVLLALLIALTSVAYLYMVYGRRSRATHFGNMSTLEKVHGFARFRINPTILIFKICIISLLFLIATQSLELREQRVVSKTDYYILLDSSPSMSKMDYAPNRLTAAKDISLEWLKVVPDNTRVGYISFDQAIEQDVPLTLSRGSVRDGIAATRIDYAKTGQGLNLALGETIGRIQVAETPVTLLLLTDGTEDIDNVTIAKANRLGVKIYAFGIGSNTTSANDTNENTSEYYNSLDLDFSVLQHIAESTGGKAYLVSDRQSLDDAMRDATLEDVQISLNTNYYILLLIAALSILEFVFYSKFGGL